MIQDFFREGKFNISADAECHYNIKNEEVIDKNEKGPL